MNFFNKLSIKILLLLFFTNSTIFTGDIELVSKEKKKFKIDETIAKNQSGLLKNMLEEQEEDDDDIPSIPVPRIETKTLKSIIILMQRAKIIKDESASPDRTAEEIKNITIETLGKEIKVKNPQDLSKLIDAANYLDAPILLKSFCYAYAGLLGNKATKLAAEKKYKEINKDMQYEIALQHLYINSKLMPILKKYIEETKKGKYPKQKILLENKKFKKAILQNASDENLEKLFGSPDNIKPYAQLVSIIIGEKCDGIAQLVKENRIGQYYTSETNHLIKHLCEFILYDLTKKNFPQRIFKYKENYSKKRYSIFLITAHVNSFLYFVSWKYEKNKTKLPIQIAISGRDPEASTTIPAIEIPESLLYSKVYPSELKRLELHDHNINALTKGKFRTLINLETLILPYNTIKSIKYEAFKGLIKVDFLSLQGNEIKKTTKNTFNPLINLKYLNLRNNHIKKIGKDTFKNNKKLKTLLLP